jgi:hypothetical protein
MGEIAEIGPGVKNLKKGDVSLRRQREKLDDFADFSRSESSFRSKSPAVNADTASRSSRRSVTEPTTLV